MILIGRLVGVIMAIVIVSSSCGGYEDLEFERSMYKKTDSIFATQRLQLKNELDSLCDLNYDDYFKRAIDSIKEKQISEIQVILEK